MALDGMQNRPVVPVPDPTELTTEQLDRSIDSLREVIGTRLDAMERATELRLEIINGIPDQIRMDVAHLREFHDERFRLQDEKFVAISLRFEERDVRTAQAAETSQKALDAALLAAAALVRQQNEANAAAAEKVELSFTKQLDQVVQQIQSEGKAKDLRISEIKERLDRGDGTTTGAHDTRSERRLDSGMYIAAFSAFVAVVSVIIAIYFATIHK